MANNSGDEGEKEYFDPEEEVKFNSTTKVRLKIIIPGNLTFSWGKNRRRGW